MGGSSFMAGEEWGEERERGGLVPPMGMGGLSINLVDWRPFRQLPPISPIFSVSIGYRGVQSPCELPWALYVCGLCVGVGERLRAWG